MSKTYIYHIYAGDKCLYHCLDENEFKTTWEMIQNLFDLIGKENISKVTYEKVSVDKEIILNSSH